MNREQEMLRATLIQRHRFPQKQLAVEGHEPGGHVNLQDQFGVLKHRHL
jgi:hypothetical protein